jgi:SOS-response transcriptional repressor LexA
MSHVPGVFPRWLRIKISEAMKAKQVTMAELSRKTGIDNSFLKRMIDRKGSASLSEDYIDAICKVLDIRIAELPKEPIQVYIRHTRKLSDPSLPQARELDYLPVPIVEPRVAAGDPEAISTEQVEDIAFIHRRALRRRSTENLICTFIRGDSMFPVIRDGAIVCIDTKARPEGGKVPKGSIWAVRKDGGAVVKHIQVGEGGIALISANPTYPPEVIGDGEAIIGRVVWMWQVM